MVGILQRGQQALKDGVELGKIKEMDIIPVLLKARMEIKDDEMPKLVDIEKIDGRAVQNISGAKIQELSSGGIEYSKCSGDKRSVGHSGWSRKRRI